MSIITKTKIKTLLSGLSLLFLFCFSSCSSEKLQVRDGIKYAFQRDDVIYFVKLDSSAVTFHFSKDGKAKDKESKNLDLDSYQITYESNYDKSKDFFEPFDRMMKKLKLTPEEYVAQKYNQFTSVLRGDVWHVTGGVRPKKLFVNDIELQDIKKFGLTSIDYFSPGDSLKTQMIVPLDVNQFCEDFSSKYADADYLILTSKVYLTKNIFRISMVGKEFWNPDAVDGVAIAPKIILDIKNKSILLYDVLRSSIQDWYSLDGWLFIMAENEGIRFNQMF